MGNRDRLRDIMVDMLLLTDKEFSFELQRDDVDTWDSLAIVAIAVAIEETFGYHLTPDEAAAITGVPDIIRTLEREGVAFDVA